MQNARNTQPERHPAMALTIGDPTGIGPEIAARFLQRHALSGSLADTAPEPLRVYGDIDNLRQTAERLGIALPAPSGSLRYMPVTGTPGGVAYEAVCHAVRDIHAGQARVLVTGPISKDNLQAAGVPYSGHTEMLEQLARTLYQARVQSDMLFLYRNFRMLLLTRHVALRNVNVSLSVKGVRRSLENLAVFLKDHARIERPSLCMLGVNPHAGEIDGDEEERVLTPAVEAVRSRHTLEITPPLAADAVFRHFDVNRIPYDAYVAAYHDQGLIPLKMIAGLEAVNVTIGLPFLRTSVSHGTAPDIAGQGIADPSSLIAAYETALQLSPSTAVNA